MRNAIVVIGSGQIGQAIARRVGVGKHVLLADVRPDNARAAAGVYHRQRHPHGWGSDRRLRGPWQRPTGLMTFPG